MSSTRATAIAWTLHQANAEEVRDRLHDLLDAIADPHDETYTIEECTTTMRQIVDGGVIEE